MKQTRAKLSAGGERLATENEQKPSLRGFDLERFKQEVAEEIGIHVGPRTRVQEHIAEQEPTKQLPD